ncbi:hypothetical protein V2J09_015973, partial [Rumex salicifolius]
HRYRRTKTKCKDLTGRQRLRRLFLFLSHSESLHPPILSTFSKPRYKEVPAAPSEKSQMGTPEFPNLGKHCAVDDCKLIDFLPFTCDRCHLVFCLEHRSYSLHKCKHANKDDVTVVICPLCAKGVRLVPDEDANITWERHVNTDCDPSNYAKVTKKKKCPAQGCREVLVFSNTIKCRDCDVDHCLKHRFGPDHKCPGPKKLETGFQFLSLFGTAQKEEPKSVPKPNRAPSQASSASSTWTKFVNAASSVMSSAETSMGKFVGNSSKTGSYPAEVCPQCYAKFSSVSDLVEHVQRVHERNNNKVNSRKVAIDACPKCSKGFSDPVKLVEHMEKEHGGSSMV